jgi:hypothetical protein
MHVSGGYRANEPPFALDPQHKADKNGPAIRIAADGDMTLLDLRVADIGSNSHATLENRLDFSPGKTVSAAFRPVATIPLEAENIHLYRLALYVQMSTASILGSQAPS